MRQFVSFFSRLVAAAVFATSAATCTAEQIFGLTIGAPIEMPVCSRRGMTPEVPASGACSAHPDATREGSKYTGDALLLFASGQLPFWASSEDSLYDSFYVRFIGGALVGATIFTRGDSVQHMTLKSLTDKFGKPNSKVSQPWQNMMGAKFTANTYKWQTGELLVEYQSFAGSLDTGKVRIGTRESFDLNRKEEEAATLRFQRGNKPL